MKRQAYLGLGECFSVHDIAITQSQGTIHEQSGEHLSSSDIAIVRARRMLDEGGAGGSGRRRSSAAWFAAGRTTISGTWS